jgi:hypothetical protein
MRMNTDLADILGAPTTRFGRPEYIYEPQFTSREAIRLMAVAYSDTVAHQAAKVARAALAKVQS